MRVALSPGHGAHASARRSSTEGVSDDVRRDDPRVITVVAPARLEAGVVRRWRAALSTIVHGEPHCVVFDLSNVEVLHASAAAAMVAAKRRLAARGAHFEIRAASPAAHAALHSLGLAHLLLA